MARMARPTPPGKQQGVAYLALLIAIACMGAALGVVGTIWHQAQQRAREEQLLFIGMEYRKAIRSYYYALPSANAYPRSLEVLLQDPRMANIKRHLRRPYRDPITDSPQWGLIQAPDGGIMGIYSLAPGQPIKTANFPRELGWSGGKKRYGEWQFIYLPESGKMGFGNR